jgi:prepilin-type N-terminal cleavage/methylation domain-containing protein
MQRSQATIRHAFTLIELIVVIAIGGALLGLGLPAVQKAREAGNRLQCRNNLHQIGIALHGYHDASGSFPAGYLWRTTVPDDPSNTAPGWGWAALLLPYLEQSSLSQQIQPSIPVEDSANEAVRTTVLPAFVCPSDQQSRLFTVFGQGNNELAKVASNSYAACFGALVEINDDPDKGNGIFFRNSHVRIADIRDGTSNTIAIGERASWLAQTPWAGAVSGGTVRVSLAAPTTSTSVEGAPVQTLAHTGSHTLNDPASDPDDFFSPHRNVGMFLFADGSTRPVRTEIALPILQALSTRAGKEPVSANEL